MAGGTHADPVPLDRRCLLARAPLAAAPDVLRRRPPDGVVPVSRTDQRVRDLVQDGVAHLGLRVQGGQRGAEADLPAPWAADTGATLKAAIIKMLGRDPGKEHQDEHRAQVEL